MPQPSSKLPTRVLFCDPEHFDVIDVKNPFMTGARIDKARARQQWENLQRCFAAAGLTVETLPAAAGLEDMVFAANQSFVGRTSQGEWFVVPSRMRYPSRQREVEHYVAWFRRQGIRVLELELGEEDYLEGHGDLLWETDMSRLWAGYGFRSTRGAVEKLSATLGEMGVEVVPLELADPRFYHLDTCLAPLAPGAVLMYPGAFTAAALERLRQHCPRVYEVPEEEALGFVCNGVAAGDAFITPRLTPTLERALQAEGLRPVVADTGEFEKSGGSVCCLKLFVP